MDIDVIEEPVTVLGEYAGIAIAFDVRQVFEVVAEAGDQVRLIGLTSAYSRSQKRPVAGFTAVACETQASETHLPHGRYSQISAALIEVQCDYDVKGIAQ